MLAYDLFWSLVGQQSHLDLGTNDFGEHMYVASV
jgi:hypothetical protein